MPISGLTEYVRMPRLGDIRKDYEVGMGNKRNNVIYVACADCSKERWVRMGDYRKSNYTGLCQPCCLKRRNGKLENSPNWKGGIKHCRGYVFVMIVTDSPYWSMADKLGYVKRSRLVMAEHIGRPLLSTEEVHHEDEDRSNDDIANLSLFASKDEHQTYHRNKEIQTKGNRPTNVLGQYITGGYNADCRSI